MGKYRLILFDLDGTLSDPKEGITKSVQFALKQMGIEEPNLDRLEEFIGPPLQESFARYYGFSEQETQAAITFYRERFMTNGMFENVLYEDIFLLLSLLHNENYHLVVATSKPTVFSETILSYFQLDKYFEKIIGSNLDGTRSSKAEIIKFILEEYKEYRKEEVIMIGDRKHDIIGANNMGIDSIGVTYGYGTLAELQQSGPTYIVDSVMGIRNVLEKPSR
ncbi:HAD-IA family hydrolase [Caldibacillus lycopersici]|uniref:HAD-IA family hydrolase n=1 Tax=Perspicuibacillus lycopersici TaxID=1325689 RepID=A0AAE3IQ75_9BACI|nr:HAD-IA family hydrolase [Perspicuibacillus lycopersici]MCU9612391.1 HAD-IA family hydrolase [Perspicuibacillus lycopersici]